MSWNSLKESRTVHHTEYVDWTTRSYLFNADDIIDPLSLLERLCEEANPLCRFLLNISSKPIMETHPGFAVTRGDSGMILRDLDQAMDALKQAESTQFGSIPDFGPLSVTLAEMLNGIIQRGLIYRKELFSAVKLSEAAQSLLERSPDGETLIQLNRLLLEDAFPGQIRKRLNDDVPSSARLVFVSHRWITPEHPDPDGTQLRELQRRLKTISEEDKSFKEALVFYDYSSMLQRPRTAQEEALFHRDLDALRRLSQQADKVLILSEGYVDYKSRGWCFFEFIVVKRKTVHLFDDQGHIRDDLGVLSGLMAEPSDLGVRGIVTSEKLDYKMNH
jgi:hypothetical protein